MRVAIVGRGRVGRGLARALEAGSWEVIETPGREPERGRVACADVVVLAVPDGAIAATAARIAGMLAAGAAVFHCAGARGPEDLAACRRAGAPVGVMHPLASFADPARAPGLRGARFVLAGDAAAVAVAERLARAVGAVPLVAPVHGPAYHATAALAANGAVALAHAAVPVLEGLGLDRRAAEQAVGALLRSVADNVETLGVPAALTGPMMRGDAETVAAHRHALAGASPEASRAYDAVAPLVLRCAVANGLAAEHARDLSRLLESDPAEHGS